MTISFEKSNEQGCQKANEQGCQKADKISVYEIYVKDHFSAAHALNGYNGNCSKIHGHNWIIETFIQCRQLNSIGIGIDFRDVKDSVKKILKTVDHTHLNELEAFKNINPTSENIAKFLYKELEANLKNEHIKVSKIKVSETPGCGSTYWEEELSTTDCFLV